MISQAVPIFVSSCLLLVLVANASQPEKPDVESVCGNKHIELTRRSQVRALVEQLKSEPENACPDRVRSALVELDQLINDDKLNDVCSLEQVDRIKLFYEKYIAQTLSAANNNNEAEGASQLPAALRNFALGYGLKVSSLCKRNMINSLQYESKQLLKPADFVRINPWTDERSALSQIMNEPTDYDDLLLPRDIERVIREEQANPDEPEEGPADDKVCLQTATGHVVARIQTLCERRFKPIYEHLIMPLIYLSNLGFNYQGEDLEREMKEMSVNKEIHQWYRIVYLCESLNGIEIVEDPSDAEKTEGTGKSVVRILSKEEAVKLRGEAKKSAQPARGGLEQVVFKPEYGNRLEDEVIDLKDKNFMKLLRSFATHKDELDRIRARLLKKVAKFVLQALKRGQFKFISSLMGNKQQSGSGNSIDEMVMLLDDYVSQATSNEAPVAGLGGLAKRYYHQAAYKGVYGMAKQVKDKTGKRLMTKQWFWLIVAAILIIASIVFG